MASRGEIFIEELSKTFTHIPPESYAGVVVCFVFFRWIYAYTDKSFAKTKWYSKLSPLDKIEWQSRVASTVHAVTAFVVAVMVWLTDNDFSLDPVSAHHPLTNLCFIWGIGYFFSDFTMVIQHKIPPMAPIILHHVFAIWGFLTCVASTRQGTWFGVVLLFTEASNPFNNTHWMLQKSERDNTPFYRTIELGYAFTWTVFRIMINPYIIWKVYTHWGDLFMRMTIYHKFILFLNLGFLMTFNTAWFITGPFYEIVFKGGSMKTKAQILKKKAT